MAWYDLPSILRLRGQVISLNKSIYLTQGNPVRLGGMLSQLAPDSSSFAAVLEHPNNSCAYFSQVYHQPGGRSAHFSFITPDPVQESDDLSTLIDFLCFQAGEMGALNVLADIEESHFLFEVLRRAGFCVFSWESIWHTPDRVEVDRAHSNWYKPSPTDENSVRSLFQTLVPPLVQNAEPFMNGGTPRLVYRTNGDIQAYVESISGISGIYLIPVIHPSVEDIRSLLLDLIGQFQGLGRPVYLQVRSYQAWLSDALLQVRAEPSPRFALMVKHLAVGQLNSSREAQRARSDQRQVEPTTSILNHFIDAGSHSEGLK